MTFYKNINKQKRVLITAFGLYVLVFVFNIVIQPLYLPLVEKNITVTISATSAHNKDALASNVRLKSVFVNDMELDLSEVVPVRTSSWIYDEENDFIYDYNPIPEDILTIDAEDVHSLRFVFIGEVGSGEVRIRMGNRDVALDLYRDTEWSEIYYSYDTAFFVRPDNHLLIQLIIFVLLLLLSLFLTVRDKVSNDMYRTCSTAAIAFVAACILTLLVYWIQFDSLEGALNCISNSSFSFIKASVFLFLPIVLTFMISKRMWVGFMIPSTISVLLVYASRIKLENRGVPLLPWDIVKMDEAASVVANYEISITLSCIMAGLTCILMAVIMRKLCKQAEIPQKIRIISAVLLCITVCLFSFSSFVYQRIDYDSLKYRTFLVNDYYERRGFITAFLEYVKYSGDPAEPAGYSEQKLTEIVEQIKTTARDNNSLGKTPNIIVIMSESFWDAEKLDTVRFKEPLLPNLTSLKEESMYGELFTHVFSGGTVVTEFEVLTGFSGEFFPPDYMVYGKTLNKDIASAVSILEQQGYISTAIHPYVATNYNRESAYESLGFDSILFDKDFEDPELVRDYISDRSLFEKIISIYKDNKHKGRPQFIFAVTVQNHGGYWEDTIYHEAEVDYETSVYGETAKKCMADYFAGLYESDKALGELVDAFREEDEETIIVYFGDHVSDAGPKGDKMLSKVSWNRDDMLYDYESHIVPFIIWNNKSHDSKDLGLMQAGSLLPETMALNGIKSNDFWGFVSSLQDSYCAADDEIIVHDTSEYDAKDNMTDQEKLVNDEYHLLQYDYLWGNRYAADLWK